MPEKKVRLGTAREGSRKRANWAVFCQGGGEVMKKTNLNEGGGGDTRKK